MKNLTVTLLLSYTTLMGFGQNTFPASGNVGIGTTSPVYNLQIDPKGPGGILIGNSNTSSGGYTSLFMNISAYSNGWAEIQSISASGSSYGNLALNSDGGSVTVGTTNPTGKFTIDYNNGEPKSLSVFTSSTNPVNSPVGGLRFSWYGSNYADIQMVRGASSIDGAGLAFLTSASNSGTTSEVMRIAQDGNVGIGTTNPQSKLAVEGTVTAQQVTVTQAGWADYVFNKGYKLRPLSEIGEYIHTHKHLPDIPSETEIEKKGLDLGDMAKKQMQKIEELTCYLLEEHKMIAKQQQEIESLKKEVRAMKRKPEKKQGMNNN